MFPSKYEKVIFFKHLRILILFELGVTFLIDNNKNALVVNDENKEVGIITKEKVIDILINRDNKISR